MTQIKKAYVELVELLEANQNKKVSTIMDDILAIAGKSGSGGSNGSTVLKDSEGKVVAIYCYYHKKWEPLAEVEYGKKANTATGLNTMCKEGVSQWTKQQRVAKSANEQLLTGLTEGKITVADLPAEQERIALEKSKIVPREDGIGFETAEEVLA